MCENHLYWLAVEALLDPRTFEAGPAKFLEAAPAPIPPLVRMFVPRNLEAISRALVDGPFNFGERLTALTEAFASPLCGEA
jgi:hypothetical protein